MKKICPTCNNVYYIKENERWKIQCYECYKNFRGYKRIKYYGGDKQNHNHFYLCHPSVTKEELDKWIEKNGHEKGWGAEEWNPKNMKLWFNYVYYD